MSRLAPALAFLLWAAPATRAADSRSLARESVILLSEGDVAGARAKAEAAVAADPRGADALRQLARAATAGLDFPAAEAAASRALAAAGPSAELLCLRSQARTGRGDFAGALRDAQAASLLEPRDPVAALRRAAALEGLGRSEQALSEYRLAAALDPGLAPIRDAARLRLRPRRLDRRAAKGFGLLALLAAVLLAMAWRRRRGAPAVPRTSGPLGGRGRVAAREALRLLVQAAPGAADPEGALALAEALYERLTGRPPYPPREAVAARAQGLHTPPSRAAADLPPGLDAFFARALNPDPARRFSSGAELQRAFRAVVEPPEE